MHYSYRQSGNDVVKEELELVTPNPVDDRNVRQHEVYPRLFGHGWEERALNGFWWHQLLAPVLPHRTLHGMEAFLEFRFIQQTPADLYVFVPAR